MGAKQLPLEETRAYQRRQAALKRKKIKQAAAKQSREMARRATKDAIHELATEAFGEGGLTPAREEALAAIVAGPDSTAITITSPNHLRHLVKKARQKMAERALDYMDVHLEAVRGAIKEGQFDVALRHTEWALEASGDAEERVIERPVKVIEGKGPAGVLVGVNLGGIPQKG